MAESRPTEDAPHDRPVRWGIVGTGGIAVAFAADLRVDPEAGELVAVASRTPKRAEAFAARVSAILALEETLSIMETLGRARGAIGLRYPGEEVT